MITNYQAIIFDFDGVVVDSEPLYEKTAAELFAEYGVTIPDDDWILYKGISADIFFKTACERYNISAPIKTFKEKNRQILKRHFKAELKYIDGFEEFIRDIPKTIKIGLVTSSSLELIQWIFKNTPIENFFPNIITASDIKKAKPHPEPFLAMNKLLHLPADNIVVIEDSVNGLVSANEAGNITIGLTTSFSRNELSEANYTADTYDDIRDILKI